MNTQLTLQEQLAYTTVRIECDHGDGTGSVGTGFLFQFQHATRGPVPAVVTNKHVLEDAQRVRFVFTAANENKEPVIGKTVSITVDPIAGNTLKHPDPDCDLEIIFLAKIIQNTTDGFYYVHLTRDQIPSTDRFLEIQSAEEVLMIGYPTGLIDTKNNRPIFRRGITATQPGLHYEGRQEFVIDAACYPGSSGSPVFRYKPALNVGPGLSGGGAQLEFLGVLWGGPQFTADGKIEIVEIPTKQEPISLTRIPMNLGFVIRADRLFEFETIKTAT